MKLFLKNYLLLILLSLLTLFSCTEKSTTDSKNPSTPPPATSLSIDYGISEDFYIALTNTALELVQKTDFGSQSNFSISPNLTNGLFLNTTNGNISGTPTNSSQPTTYTITAIKDSKTYTKAISLGVAPSVAWVISISSNYLKAYVVGDGAKQISDWIWGSSDESFATVNDGMVSFNITARRGSSAIIYARKDTSAGSAQGSYSNGISITVKDLSGSKVIVMGTSINLIINSEIKVLTNSQFKNKDLTTVVIPNSVTTIGVQVFEQNQLASVVIPDSVTTIGGSAFYGNKLTSVVIPNSVTTIDNWAFANNQLVSVVIPNSVTNVGRYAFQVNQLTNVVIPNSVTTIGRVAFYSNKLSSVVIPNSISNIEHWVFQANQLTNVVIPNSVTNIGTWAFDNNELTSVVIPNSVTNIGNGAFTKNPNLLTVNLKQSLYTKITSTSGTTAVFGSQVTNYIKRP